MTQFKTTLLVEPNDQLADYFSINLHTWVGVNSEISKQARFAIEHLQKDPNKYDLIITRAKIATERSAEALVSFLSSSKLEIPIIVIGDEVFNDDKITCIPPTLEIKPLVQAAAKVLEISAQDMANLEVPNFFQIPIQHFNIIREPICDVFQLDPEEKPTLLFKEFTEIPQDKLKQKIAEGEFYLYVQKNNRLKFVTNINQEIAAKLELQDLNDDEQVLALEMSQDLLREKIARLGVNEETIELSKRNLKYMVGLSKKEPSLKHLLRRLMKNKSSYHFKHSQVLMFVATHLMDQLDWVNEEQRNKLQFISFWHDISLENSEQALIHSEEELKTSNLSSKEKDLVKKHAQLSATIVSQYPSAPIGAEQIIKQHHGTINGIGFSEHYSQNISPMAIVFILAEDLVESVIHAQKGFKLETKIAEMREKYSTQRFQKIINALETITK